MKVVVYSVNFSPELTGIGKYTGDMVQWLTSHGHEVRVVTAPPYYPQWSVLKGYSSKRWRVDHVDGALIYRCPLWVPARLSGLKRLLHLCSFALSSAPIMFWQVRWLPELVMVIEPSLICTPVTISVARLVRAKALLHIQDFEVDAAFELGMLPQGKVRGAVTFIERWLMNRFDRISTISNRMLKRLYEKGVTEERGLLFPNWVDTRKIIPLKTVSRLREELGIPNDEIAVLYSGNMGEKQGLEIVIGAAGILSRESAIRFIMCGHGAAYSRLRELGDGLDNITWLPLQPIDKLNELLNAADIHLLPQRADAADLVMPSKLTGILASGRPVVATAHPGTEVWNVVQGRGIAVEPGNVEAFADAIQKLTADAELRKSLGMAAREYAVAELDKKKVLSEFEAELVSLVEGAE
jgi:colanic acid biosynthesis glycosyl transferase WcaI